MLASTRDVDASYSSGVAVFDVGRDALVSVAPISDLWCDPFFHRYIFLVKLKGQKPACVAGSLRRSPRRRCQSVNENMSETERSSSPRQSNEGKTHNYRTQSHKKVPSISNGRTEVSFTSAWLYETKTKTRQGLQLQSHFCSMTLDLWSCRAVTECQAVVGTSPVKATLNKIRRHYLLALQLLKPT